MIYSENYWQEQIHRIMPDIEIKEVDLYHEGLVNDVLIVNRKWVIRFTKTDYGKEMMALEARLMRFLHPLVSMNLPFPVKHEDGGSWFMNCWMGRIFCAMTGSNWMAPNKMKLPKSLGSFLKQLNDVPLQNPGWGNAFDAGPRDPRNLAGCL